MPRSAHSCEKSMAFATAARTLLGVSHSPCAAFVPTVTSLHVASSVKPISALMPRRRAVPSCTTPPPPSDQSAESLLSQTHAPAPPPASANSASSAAATSAAATDESIDLAAETRSTLAWIAIALLTGAAIFNFRGHNAGLEFLTAYIVEYSLSVDNLFVFILIFSYFKLPRNAQPRVLSFGIAGAVIFRGIMIVGGEALTQRFKVVSLGFAALLLFSAGKLLFSGDEDEEDLSDSAIVKFARSILPFSDAYDGDKFVTSVNGQLLATPLMLVLLTVEFSDVVFALDSVPAVLGISNDTAVIYLSNILAIVGLRNLFFVLSDSIADLRFLPQALAVVLGFVGGKMGASVFGYHVGNVQSLAVVVGSLAMGVALSLAFPSDDDAEGEEAVR